MPEDSHFQRLVDCVAASYDGQQVYRELHRTLVDASMGEYYPRAMGKAPDTPMNLMWMTHRAMSRWLYMRDPRAMVNTSVPQWKSLAEDGEIAVNRTIKQSKFGRTLSRVVDQSLYSVGALELTADYVGNERDMKQELVLKDVPLADLVWDGSCRDFDESEYNGRKLLVKLIDVKQHPWFNPENRAKVTATRDTGFGSDADRVSFQRAYSSSRTDLYDVVEVWRVWDRSANRLYVWPVDQPDLKLLEHPWNGPRHGPIRFLHYGSPPGHAYPVSPMQNFYKLARASNILLTKALQQQQTAKGLVLYTSAQKEEARRVVNSPDMNSVLQEHGPLRWTHVGGTSPDTVSMSEMARKLFSYVVGNLDQLLGLGSQSPTLGQERMLSDSTTANMADMAQSVFEFVKGATGDAYWFNVRDPQSRSKLWKPLGRTGVSYDVAWTPEKRRIIEQMDFEVDVEPFSYRSRTPDGKLADLLGSLQVLSQWTPQMTAQGMMLDIEAIARTIAKYKDLPELHDALILNQDPQQLAKLMGPREGTPPMENPGIHRYERTSRSDGAGQEQELLRMFGRGQENAEAQAA